MRITILSFVVCVGVLACVAQEAKKKPEPKGPVVSTSLGQAFVEMEDAPRLKIRDLEYRANQLEIEIQSMKAKIEEDKAKEADIWKQIQAVASDYAKEKHVDSADYDFDAAETKFIKKKKP